MITLNQMNINVEINGEGNTNIILLHGWGQSTKAFSAVISHLADKYKTYAIDLPGFGLSDKPSYPFSTTDYASIIRNVIEYFQIKSPVIIGHSFGGRVAIKYTALYNNVKKLVLVDSAGIVHKKPLIYYIKVYSYKILKRIFSLPILRKYKNKVLSKFGSTDYKNADTLMKQTLVKVVNEDLRVDMKNIKCPTLLVWGTDDYATPIGDAYIMKEHLLDAGIVKITNAGHFSYLDNLPLFLSVIDVFLRED